MQTHLFEMTKTEKKIDRMMSIASKEVSSLNEQIAKLTKERDGWFAAFHSLRTLGDVSREAKWSQKKLKEILAANCKESKHIEGANNAYELSK